MSEVGNSDVSKEREETLRKGSHCDLPLMIIMGPLKGKVSIALAQGGHPHSKLS